MYHLLLTFRSPLSETATDTVTPIWHENTSPKDSQLSGITKGITELQTVKDNSIMTSQLGLPKRQNLECPRSL